MAFAHTVFERSKRVFKEAIEVEAGLAVLGGSITGPTAAYNSLGSFQPVGPDLTLGVNAGTSGVGDSDFLAAVMGNILGSNLTRTNNYIAGVFGAYTITGTNASVYPKGALVGEIGDATTTADGCVVAAVGGDSATTKAVAAFKLMQQNSQAASGVDFGVDLFGAAHSGYLEAAVKKAAIRMDKEVCVFQGAGVPADGSGGTGAGFAEKGSYYADRTNGDGYINAGTKASPTWKKITRAA